MVHVVDGWEFRNIRQHLNLHEESCGEGIGVVQCDDIRKIITYINQSLLCPHTPSMHPPSRIIGCCCYYY